MEQRSADASANLASTGEPLRLGLLTTLDLNIGDDFIREAIIYILKRLLLGRRLELVAVDKLRPHTAYERSGPLINAGLGRGDTGHQAPGRSRFDDCDLVVQCGSPIIWEDCRNSKWAGPIWRDVLARLAATGKLVLNMGGGSGYPWERRPKTLVGNPDEAFIHLMLEAARLTTVRDGLARDLLRSLGYDVPQLCCPAIILGQTFAAPVPPTRKVLINFMRGGSLFDWEQHIDIAAWERTMHGVVTELRGQGWQPLLIAHEECELELAAQIWPDLPRVCPTDRHEYFSTVRDAAFGIFNRLHASVVAAGLGIPSLAIGTDCRLFMIEAIGLPVLYTKDATAERILAVVQDLADHREAESRRLLRLREVTLQAYMECLRPILGVALPAPPNALLPP